MVKVVKVIKRDGTSEEFDHQKIIQILTVAGLDAVKAKQVSLKVKEWVEGLEQDSVSSLEIKDRVLEELKGINEYIAQLFDWYEKSKEEVYVPS
jgi:transcriptional regulator NrdR family protein